MKTRISVCLAVFTLAASLDATEFQVATNGSDSNAGTLAAPFHTIQHAAKMAQPGDVITVHEGVYRERIDPPRGGTSDSRRITYQAAPGERVVITGSEPVKGWVRVTNDVWRVIIPNSYFGKFNPYTNRIHGDWCRNPGGYHTGAVYLNGNWLEETTNLDNLLNPKAEPVPEKNTGYFLNVAWFEPVQAGKISATQYKAQQGVKNAPCSEGGECIGWINNGDWVRYGRVDFGAGTESIKIRAASLTGGVIEIREESPTGPLLGTCAVANTGGWQAWQTFTAKIRPVSGRNKLCMVFRPPLAADNKSSLWFVKVDADKTRIWAQFPGENPNVANVEINVRQTVFTPSQTGINYLTVRGFTLCDAAAPWAPPTAAQIGVISAYWCKGWIIESNNICYSPCCGVALGKYGDKWDNRAGSAKGYVGTITRALTNGWNKERVGSHLVRDNEISHCEQAGIVGSLGCAFSTVTGNEIHDIHIRNLYEGAEMAGIKFHGAIDVAITHNHIYRCGSVAGIWLDWMAQGCQVVGNLMHDNSQDIFFEMQHGPILVANNLFLSGRAFAINSQGIAFVHNLIAGSIRSFRGDTRVTPFQRAHSTEIAGMYASVNGDSGDDRFYNNLFAQRGGIRVMDDTVLPCFAAGNVFTKDTEPSMFGINVLAATNFDPAIELEQKASGWYLSLAEDPVWRNEGKRQLVTTKLLGKAKDSNCTYDNRDSSPVKTAADYLDQKRDEKNPFPGPFENPSDGNQEIKVWPVGPAGQTH